MIDAKIKEKIKEENKVLPYIDTHDGIEYGIIRSNNTGALCGYLEIPKRHVLHRVGYTSIPIDVHGGWTFDSVHCPYDINKKGQDNWYIGFDCAHYGDLVPHIDEIMSKMRGHTTYSSIDVYRDLAYVKDECVNAATWFSKNWIGHSTLEKIPKGETTSSLGMKRLRAMKNQEE